MRDNMMPELATAALGTGAAKTIGLTGLAGVAAGAVAITLTPPKTTKEFFRRLLVTVLTSVFAGPLVVEWGGFSSYTLSSQIGICFLTGVPSWLVLSYVVYWLEKSQKRSPVQLADDFRKIKGGDS